MPDTEHLRIQLDYPLDQVKEPIVYRLVTEFRLIPNIRRANIDVHTGGMIVLEVEGVRADLEAAMAYMRGLGITVTEIGSEHSWTI